MFQCNITTKITNKMHYIGYYSKSALHVSGDVFAHHQELLTVFTVSGSVHPSCCRLVSRRDISRKSNNYYIFWVRVYSLDIQLAKRMLPNAMLFEACPAILFFFHIISQTSRFSGERYRKCKCFLLSLQLLSETFFILRRIQREMIINVHRSSCKAPVIFVRF
jgi:hypothetical protein